MKTFFKILGKIISFSITAFLIFTIIYIYTNYYFNDYNKAILKADITSFYRDNEQKMNDKKSYCIDSADFNDAMFFKTIEVEKNTPYKVSCYIKTENVENEVQKSEGGANICIQDTVEKSKSVVGNSDWELVTFYFDSKDREIVDICFRLGSYNSNTKGKVWFSDINVEKGEKEESNEWNVACVILKYLAVKIENEDYLGIMSDEDIESTKDNIDRFKKFIETETNEGMKINYDVIVVPNVINSISYDEENLYYIDPLDIKQYLETSLKEKEYDHIFAVVRMGTDTKEIPVNSWIGLGGMDYLGIGFSNIRMPNNSRSNIYKYHEVINPFPEEVYVHEFLHSLERNSLERNIERPDLHDYGKYGYKQDTKIGLRDWYIDYLNKNIIDTDGSKIGLDSEIFLSQRVNSDDFIEHENIEFDREPENIIEAAKLLFENVTKIIEVLKNDNQKMNSTAPINSVTIAS